MEGGRLRSTCSLSLGHMDRQVVASRRKLSLPRDLRWVAKRTQASFLISTRKAQKIHCKAGYPLFHWLIID